MTHTPVIHLIPLGGLREIGMNCLALEAGERIVVIDCGIGFCVDHPTARIMHPNFRWLVERASHVEAIVITHGHEDHIGALPYLLEHVQAPVYAPPYALDLIRTRMDEYPDVDIDLHLSRADDVIAAGGIEVQRFRVHHSIPDATGLIVKTPAGTIVHSGDFKIESNPAEGQHFDHAKLSTLDTRLLLSDSTNVTVTGRAGNERDVAAVLETAVASIEQRVVVSIFASNVFRLRTLVNIARQYGRKICLIGRSVQKHAEIAQKHRWLPDLSSTLVSPEQAAQLPRQQLMVIATGTQGEKEAALARLAFEQQRHVVVEPGDVVILSSRVIPGNEDAVRSIVEAFRRRRIEVRDYASTPGLHASGHAGQEEQRELIRLVQPEAFVPVHGTPHHLETHAALAAEEGVNTCCIIENGDILEVTSQSLNKVGTVPVGRVYIEEGRGVGR